MVTCSMIKNLNYYLNTRGMFFLFLKVIIIVEVVCYRGAVHSYGENEIKNNFIQDIMEKIEKIANTVARASVDERPKLLSELEEKLRKATSQSFREDGAKYVELIMQGVKLKASNNISNSSSSDRILFESNGNTDSIVVEHITKEITDKIESFAKKYLMTLRSIDDKRVFLDNVRKKMIELAQAKYLKLLNGDIVSYSNTITNSLNDIYIRNLEHYSRRTITREGNIGDNQGNHTQKKIDELLHHNDNKPILSSDLEHVKLDKECIVSTALACSEIDYLNKSKCAIGEKTIYVDNICDGTVDCPDGSDEANCIDQVAQSLIQAKNILLQINATFEQNCHLEKFNGTFTKIDIMHDWILAQINVIDDCEENFQHNNEAGNLRNAINTLNQVTLNLSKGVCAQQEKARELVANARRFHRILDKDLEEVLRDSALFPKSCICSEDRCVSKTCVKSCENACLLKYRLGRWSCPGFNDSTSVHLNAICDGKFDCFDESDERDCSEGKGRGKFEANEAFLKVTKVLEMKMASKENEPVRNVLLRLYKSIIFLQHLISASNPNTKYVKIVRDRSFTLLSLIYGNYMRHTYNSNDAEQMYRFLYEVNKILVEALKRSHTGNTKLISSNDCICRKDKCIKLKCSPTCVRACSVESKLTRYYCKESPDNSSVAIGALCNGKKNCPNGDDEINCSAEICRRHHFYSLRLSIQDVGKDRDGTGLGEILKFWRTKASSILLLAEANIGRPTPQYLRQIVKDLLQDLVFAYASFETNKKNIADTAFREFFDLSQRVVYALKTCGKSMH